MSGKFVIELDTQDEVNMIAGALGALPYGEVFQLLDKIGKQIGPQMRVLEESKEEE